MADKTNMVIFAAANEVGISEREMKGILVTQRDGFFEITFSTEWMMYDMYVEEESMMVLGVDFRPIPVNSLLESLPESVQDAS
ncbi:hypothetical protein D6855_03880 [Butyrivibrio sp. CB08]|uniref:hypothetical protein n=1 Tax=Butyrivibrio sp. CB08 TaxID=2364879 RepID=UPI000EA8B140|nr:hypothetical protein [Butyrivibrio sp. CB08]RKM61048.1 hypothetical protein D6855_03880 [Butyrivibrio sp. CB08]